jgi:hypothetical protein
MSTKIHPMIAGVILAHQNKDEPALRRWIFLALDTGRYQWLIETLGWGGTPNGRGLGQQVNKIAIAIRSTTSTEQAMLDGKRVPRVSFAK